MNNQIYPQIKNGKRMEKITTQLGQNFGVEPGKIIVFSGPAVRTLDDMSKEEILKLENHYGCKVVDRWKYGLR